MSIYGAGVYCHREEPKRRGDLSRLHCHSEGALPPKGNPKNLGGGRKCGDYHAEFILREILQSLRSFRMILMKGSQ